MNPKKKKKTSAGHITSRDNNVVEYGDGKPNRAPQLMTTTGQRRNRLLHLLTCGVVSYFAPALLEGTSREVGGESAMGRSLGNVLVVKGWWRGGERWMCRCGLAW